MPPAVTTSAPPPPPASDPLETQAGKVQEAQVRFGEGWREGERWTCSRTPHWGEVTEGRELPQGPQLTAPDPCPNSWFSLLGNGGFWGLSEKGVQPQLQACSPKLFCFLAPSPSPF